MKRNPYSGYCLYASIKLSNELSKNNIDNEIIEGYLSKDEIFCTRHYWVRVKNLFNIDIGSEISNIIWNDILS